LSAATSRVLAVPFGAGLAAVDWVQQFGSTAPAGTHP
jgi:hypothetical protein